MAEQRNEYKGEPPRPWIRLLLVAANGSTREMDALADTGNPCSLIIGPALFDEFNLGFAPGMSSNFGPLAGGWLRIQIPVLGFDSDVLAYSGKAVAEAAAASHSDFEGLAGLPLLRMLEYGGDAEAFWIRPIDED